MVPYDDAAPMAPNAAALEAAMAAGTNAAKGSTPPFCLILRRLTVLRLPYIVSTDNVVYRRSTFIKGCVGEHPVVATE